METNKDFNWICLYKNINEVTDKKFILYSFLEERIKNNYVGHELTINLMFQTFSLLVSFLFYPTIIV